MGDLLERWGITEDVAVGFMWRVWNVIKIPMGVILASIVGLILKDIVDAGSVSVILSWSYWDGILVAIADMLIVLLGIGGAAGIDKVWRSSKEVRLARDPENSEE